MKKQTKRPRRTTIIDEIEQKKAQFELERDDYFKNVGEELEKVMNEGIDVNKESMRENLLKMTKDEILMFIRNRRSKKFDMSGYGDDNNSCNIENMNLLNEFADCGIYDYVEFLSLEAYKGCVNYHFQWFQSPDNRTYHVNDLCGWTTAEILCKIIEDLYIYPTNVIKEYDENSNIRCPYKKRRMN